MPRCLWRGQDGSTPRQVRWSTSLEGMCAWARPHVSVDDDLDLVCVRVCACVCPVGLVALTGEGEGETGGVAAAAHGTDDAQSDVETFLVILDPMTYGRQPHGIHGTGVLARHV